MVPAVAVYNAYNGVDRGCCEAVEAFRIASTRNSLVTEVVEEAVDIFCYVQLYNFSSQKIRVHSLLRDPLALLFGIAAARPQHGREGVVACLRHREH